MPDYPVGRSFQRPARQAWPAPADSPLQPFPQEVSSPPWWKRVSEMPVFPLVPTPRGWGAAFALASAAWEQLREYSTKCRAGLFQCLGAVQRWGTAEKDVSPGWGCSRETQQVQASVHLGFHHLKESASVHLLLYAVESGITLIVRYNGSQVWLDSFLSLLKHAASRDSPAMPRSVPRCL